MRLPRFNCDVPQYKQTIIAKLGDPHCHLFLDTNVVLQLYELKSQALCDFFAWIDDSNGFKLADHSGATVASGLGRIHIPKWVAFEISNLFLTQNPFADKAKVLNECSLRLQNAVDLLRYSAEDDFFAGLKTKLTSPLGWAGAAAQVPLWYQDRNSLLDGLDHVAEVMGQGFEDFKDIIKKRKALLDTEVSERLEPLFLPSDIFSILEKISALVQCNI